MFYDQAYTGAGMKVAEVIKDGPLDKAGMNVRPGMIIESVDGQAIAPGQDIAQFLNRKAGKPVLLVVADGEKKTDVVAKPITLAEENRLLYARWVRRNQDEVDRLSNGQLGYIHVPGMNDGAYRTTFEEAMGKYAPRKGLVVDTRFNGGGDLVADLAMFLSGKQFFELHHRHAQQRVRAELPLDQAERVAGQRGELQRRPLLRLHVQGAQARAAGRHAGARHLHVRRLGDRCRTACAGACPASA